jgi:predicted translin family RNA/ssDNA-binding protein
MSVSSLRIAGSVVVLSSLLLLPITAWAQAEDEPFRRGIAARGDKKWGEVAEEMRKAIAINPTESTRKVQVRARIIFGGNSTEYLPHFYLGDALKNQGNCAAAVAEWETSEDQKVILGVQQALADLRAGYKECAAKGVLLRDGYQQQLTSTEQSYNDAVNSYKRLETLRGANPEVFKDGEGDFERARQDLNLAYKVLLKARASRLAADFSEARNATTRVANVLRPLDAKLGAAISARTLIAQQSAETQQVLSKIETTERAIDAVKIAMPPELATARDSGRALIRSSRERLGMAEKTQSATAAGEALRQAREAADALARVLEQLNDLVRSEARQRFQQLVAAATEQLSFVTNSFETLDRLVVEKAAQLTPEMAKENESLQKSRSSIQRRFDNSRKTENVTGIEEAMRDRGVHEALEKAARLYFTGEYQQVLSALDPLGTALDVLLQVHVHVFRAASLYALYVRSGETNEKLRTDALVAIRRCKEIEPGFQPSARAFSPRFLAFFQSGGTPGAPPAATAAAQ